MVFPLLSRFSQVVAGILRFQAIEYSVPYFLNFEKFSYGYDKFRDKTVFLLFG